MQRRDCPHPHENLLPVQRSEGPDLSSHRIADCCSNFAKSHGLHARMTLDNSRYERTVSGIILGCPMCLVSAPHCPYDIYDCTRVLFSCLLAQKMVSNISCTRTRLLHDARSPVHQTHLHDLGMKASCSNRHVVYSIRAPAFIA